MASDRTTRDDQRSASFLACSAKSAPAPSHQFRSLAAFLRTDLPTLTRSSMPCHTHGGPMVAAMPVRSNGCDSRMRRRASPHAFSKIKAKVIRASCQHRLRYCTVLVQYSLVQSSYLGSNLANRKLLFHPPCSSKQLCCTVARCSLLAVPTPTHWRRATLAMSNRLVLRTPYRTYSPVREALPCPALP